MAKLAEKKTEFPLQEHANYREQPHNVLAEQMVLGTLLTNNDLLQRIGDFLLPEHFFQPIHQRIFEAIIHFNERGVLANPVTLKNHFDKDEALKELGGGQYLAKLAGLSSTIINVHDYGKVIYDLSIRRALISIGEEVVNDAFEESIDTSATDQIEAAEERLFKLASEGYQDSGFKALKSSLAETLHRAELAYKQKQKITGTSTGYRELDALLGGLQRSDLIILAARPSMGKTALTVNLAWNACKNLSEDYHAKKKAGKLPEDDPGLPSVGLFSLEMSAEQITSRLLSMVSHVNSFKLRTGQLTEDEFSDIIRANNQMQSMPFYIDDTPALSISALRTRARRLKRRHNLSVLMVDYLQLVRGSSKNDGNRVQEISEITQGLKAIAKELNIPVIALSQLSRAVEQREDKRPQLSDLRESGSIEQDADIVMFIYRDDYYLARKEPRVGTPEHDSWQQQMNQAMNITDLIIAKQRNGPIGNVRLFFDANTTTYTNLVDIPTVLD